MALKEKADIKNDAACESNTEIDTMKTEMPKKIKLLKAEYDRRIDAVCYLFLIFLTGCFVGWVYEEFFYWWTEGALRNRGILYGPWLPIYGIGALAIYAMKPLKKHPLLLFSMCVFLTGLVEYIIGLAGIKYFHIKLWDYSGLFLNIGGIICFRSVVSFGVMGMAFHYLIEPFAAKMYAKSKQTVIYVVCLTLLFIMLLDCICSTLFRTPITY